MITRIFSRQLFPLFRKQCISLPSKAMSLRQTLVCFNHYNFSDTHNKNSYYEVVKYYQQILEINSDNVNILYDLALVHQKHHKFDDAIPILEQIIKMDPTFSSAYNLLARIYLEQNIIPEALDLLNLNLENHSNNFESLLLLGMVEYRRKEYFFAIDRFEQCLKFNPTCLESILHLGICYRNINGYEQSIRYLRQYLKHVDNPSKGNEMSEGYNQLGLTFEQKQELQEAIKCFKKALEFNPKNSQAYKNITFAYIKLQKIDKANKYLGKVPDELKNDFEFVSASGYILEQNGDLNEAISNYETLREQFVKDHKLYLTIGNCHLRLGNLDKAEEQYTKGLRTIPQKFYTGLAEVAKAKGNLEQAISFYEQVIKYDPDNRHAYLCISNILEQDYKFTEAISYCYQAMEISPNSVFVNHKLSRLHLMAGNLEEAISFMKKCIELEPNHAEHYYQLGALQNTFDQDEALLNFKKCLSIFPSHPLLKQLAEELAKEAALAKELAES